MEQVLASHSQVEGASELPYLRQVIEAETRRCSKPFPQWVQIANADDWARVCGDYLAMSARWHTSHPVAIDKLPNRTPSALQVHWPLRQTSTPAAGYARLMNLLRQGPIVQTARTRRCSSFNNGSRSADTLNRRRCGQACTDSGPGSPPIHPFLKSTP